MKRYSTDGSVDMLHVLFNVGDNNCDFEALLPLCLLWRNGFAKRLA